jgi:nitroreductase
MTKPTFIPLSNYRQYPHEEMIQRSAAFCADMQRRRSVRSFSDRPVPREVIENCLRAAGTAPSGANMQPWQFVVVSDPDVKQQIRENAEEQERRFYDKPALQEWVEAVRPLGTDAHKPFLTTAPYLIVIFAQRYGLSPGGHKIKHYYVSESVGIATGILITAIHQAGLVSLTYTPSRMDFLNDILARPATERPFLILVFGYPCDDAVVPDLARKPLEQIVTFI